MCPALLLDVTRLVSRLGSEPMTGIDRVEQAYLEELLSRDAPAFGLVRSAVGFLLLDRHGLSALRDRKLNLSKSDFWAQIFWRKTPQRGNAEAAIRRLAIARCSRPRLGKLLSKYFDQSGIYFNVGHANLKTGCLTQIKSVLGTVVVLVHDTIPLDHPEFTRKDTLGDFHKKLKVVADVADYVIYSTKDARQKAEAHFAKMGRVPASIIASLGVVSAIPAPLSFNPSTPYFVCLGTIEPRKNHSILLDIWKDLPAPVPHLYIVGKRGWANPAVFQTLDALSVDGPVTVLSNLTDGEVVSLLSNAHALLFPSMAEGFGLPAIEAAALGIPLILSDLAVFKEICPDNAVYLKPDDRYSWLETIAHVATNKRQSMTVMSLPRWAEHFKIVFASLAENKRR